MNYKNYTRIAGGDQAHAWGSREVERCGWIITVRPECMQAVFGGAAGRVRRGRFWWAGVLGLGVGFGGVWGGVRGGGWCFLGHA